ncbi:MAG: DUF5112 domain-containing protein [Prevotella sp.]|nr:DUF5112 domain-containing protein [Prevotella sp.]
MLNISSMSKRFPRWRHFFVFIALVCVVFSSCIDKRHAANINDLNATSYYYHYRNLDSTLHYATLAYEGSMSYGSGRAEAMNNKAFVCIARMEYDRAKALLDSIETATSNTIELLIADVQQMRICQRESNNKDFYRYRERALNRLSRIAAERSSLDEHNAQRLVYGESELHIVETAYFYYVGLDSLAQEAMSNIDPNGELKTDTAQLLNYFYNMGSGGLMHSESHEDIVNSEMQWLLRCYQVADRTDNPYWKANSLQAISEHMENEADADLIIKNYATLQQMVSEGKELSARIFAEQALDLFEEYGDVYQTAGSLRTLGECYFAKGMYEDALDCLNEALMRDTIIFKAPDLVASIREQLSMTYSALDEKPLSDYNRNIYLDLQEDTRQDRQWEARAEQLTRSSSQVNRFLAAVGIVALLVMLMLSAVYRQMKSRGKKYTDVDILSPLVNWTEDNKNALRKKRETRDELIDAENVLRQKIVDNRQLNIEQRAKVSYVMGLRPLIDRAVREIELLKDDDDERREYISELFAKITDYNSSLTRWIEMRRGEFNLQVESFRLEELFTLIRNSSFAYKKDGIDLIVKPTDAVVKADKALTLFMINTLSDNARKFTPAGGEVVVDSEVSDKYIEISVADTGCGMSKEQVSRLFDHKRIVDQELTSQSFSQSSHGFGLLNCKGIIEKYKKTSQIFHVCEMLVESEVGKGSRISFRLPRGRIIGMILMLLSFSSVFSFDNMLHYDKLNAYADSAYNCNVVGDYSNTLVYADSCRAIINEHIHSLYPNKEAFMSSINYTSDTPAEIEWFREGVSLDYNIILSIRNECAVAALALHDWDLYNYNNKVYTQLFREMSTDTSIPTFVKIIERSRANKNIAIALFVILTITLVFIFYIYYHRKRMTLESMVDRVGKINNLIESDDELSEKASRLSQIWNPKGHGSLDDIVKQSISDINNVVEESRTLDDDIELRSDVVRSLTFENNRLHVSNNVLDNCLSTLKHETMYFPARLQMLINENSKNDVESIRELAIYYRDLYSILSQQAVRQTQVSVHPDHYIISYLMELLTKLNNNTKPRIEEHSIDNTYTRVDVIMDEMKVSETDARQLFTSDTIDFRFLICRQIMREIGEWTGFRGCGINARREESIADNPSTLTIEIIIPQKIWIKSKS